MEVHSLYHIPFKSEFDWRVTLHEMMHDIHTEVISELISKYKQEDQELDWKDNDEILAFALNEDLFKKAAERAVEKAEQTLRENFS